MKICCISDTHTKHRQVTVPECDVLCHAGDLTSTGESKTILDFLKWFNEQPAKHKVYIAGNHDMSYEESPGVIKTIHSSYPNIHYLHDEEVVIDGVKFYGSPYQPRFFDWAFNLDRGEPLKRKWSIIPDDTNVLITHGPPYGVLDTVPSGESVGCEDLLNRVCELSQLKLHIFGHIHLSHGETTKQNTRFVNACICTERYDAHNEPIIVEI